MKKTALHAKNAIDDASYKEFIHEDLVYGCGFWDDFIKCDSNDLVLYYNDHIGKGLLRLSQFAA